MFISSEQFSPIILYTMHASSLSQGSTPIHPLLYGMAIPSQVQWTSAPSTSLSLQVSTLCSRMTANLCQTAARLASRQ